MIPTTQIDGPQAFARYLEDCGLNVTYDPARRLFGLRSQPDQQLPDIWVQWLQGTGVVRVFTWIVQDIPEKRLPAMALQLARINHNLLVPGFVLDLDARWVAWRGVALLDSAGSISSDVPASLVHMAKTASDRYHRAIAAAAAPEAPLIPGELPAWAAP